MEQAASPNGLSLTSMVVPYVQVEALSQAWYDALGLANRHPEKKIAVKAVVAGMPPQIEGMPILPGKMSVTSAGAAGNAVHALKRRSGSLRSGLVRVRQLDELRSTRRIASVHPPAPDEVVRHSAGRITILSKRGVIRMLVQRDAHGMRITAVCSPAIVGQVTDSLQVARMRLAARGIMVATSTHEEARS